MLLLFFALPPTTFIPEPEKVGQVLDLPLQDMDEEEFLVCAAWLLE